MSCAIEKKQKVLVGMSGGVDSSLAALLLKENGCEVIGVTMKIWPQTCFSNREKENACCGPKAILDARSVAETLDVPYYVLNHQKEFERVVIGNFVREYNRGRTPIPCVHCNKELKFGSLLRKAQRLGIEKVATGHYARCDYEKGRYVLKRARDERKDQSYFLFSLSQEQLARVFFPVGELTKEEVRAKAKAYKLTTHDKPESQEICFVADNTYTRFLREQPGVEMVQGPIVDRMRNQLGMHRGFQGFTIGQRKGLGALGRAAYVVAIEAEANTVVVGNEEDLLGREFWIEDENWIAIPRLEQPIRVVAKIRSTHAGASATVYPGEAVKYGGKVRVVFDKPERAITPGQAAVFYQGESVVGGGWIGGNN